MPINEQFDFVVDSRISKNRTHRFYTTTQLSNVLNSLEAYLGQHASERSQFGKTNGTHGGLHLVVVVDTPQRVYNATERKPLRFHISGSSRSDAASSIALVPQWGAFISLDDVNINLDNLGGVLVNTIRSFVGLPVRGQSIVSVGGGGSMVLLESGSIYGRIIKWEVSRLYVTLRYYFSKFFYLFVRSSSSFVVRLVAA